MAAVFRVACSAPAGGRIEVRHSPSGDPLASVDVPAAGGRYEWTDITVPLGLSDGSHDLYLALHGHVRLDWFRLERG